MDTLVTLKPGESRIVEISLRVSDLSYWNEAQNAFVVDPGNVNIMMGASSVDIKAEKVLKIE